MEQTVTTVLVTGVGGGGNGEQLVKSLRYAERNYRVIGADLTLDAARQSGADACIALPRANDPGYTPALLAACKQHGVEVILPGSEPEMRVLARDAALIRSQVKLLAVNDAELIETCSNKFKTTQFLQAHGFACPRSWLIDSLQASEQIDLFPIIVKPVVGGGSQNVYLIQDRDELVMILGYLLRYFENVLVQEYVGSADQEFTVGVLFDGDGHLIHSIALNRFILSALSNRLRVPNRTGRAELGEVLAISSGVSQGRVDAFPHVTEYCEQIGLALGARYAINVQCRCIDGQPYAFEINPRFSGTSSIRAMLGFNEPDLLIRKHVLGEEIPLRAPYRHATVLRGLKEVIVEEGNA
jgi:carbamoyl-phosphate synthase large subunit